MIDSMETDKQHSKRNGLLMVVGGLAVASVACVEMNDAWLLPIVQAIPLFLIVSSVHWIAVQLYIYN
jgi:hypothetical protein